MRRSIAILALGLPWCLTASAGDAVLSAVVRGSYTTSSKLFNNPDAASPEVRSRHTAFDGIPGWGSELRYHWPHLHVFVSLSIEYLEKTREQKQLVAVGGEARRLPVREGFRALPVELGLHAFIPIGSDRVKVSMGGGLGAYYGERILSIAGVGASMQNRPVNVGIHVETAVEYRIWPGVWAKGEMRFRDPEIRTLSRFQQPSTEYEDVVVYFPQGEFATRINVDGMIFSLGLAIEIL